MKTLITGLLFVGLTSLGFSQSNGIEEVELSEVNITPINLTYLKEVQDKTTPERVKKLENKVSRFDITESPVFSKDFEAYEVVFKENDGKIIATFDNNGKILTSLERFENILPPRTVMNSVLMEYPGWAVHKDTYLVSYYGKKNTKKVYKIQIRKDGKRKNLKVDVSGNII